MQSMFCSGIFPAWIHEWMAAEIDIKGNLSCQFISKHKHFRVKSIWRKTLSHWASERITRRRWIDIFESMTCWRQRFPMSFKFVECYWHYINFGTRQKYLLSGNVSENMHSGTSCLLLLLSFTVIGLRRCCITAITELSFPPSIQHCNGICEKAQDGNVPTCSVCVNSENHYQ